MEYLEKAWIDNTATEKEHFYETKNEKRVVYIIRDDLGYLEQMAQKYGGRPSRRVPGQSVIREKARKMAELAEQDQRQDKSLS
jgi:hypothetical protein